MASCWPCINLNNSIFQFSRWWARLRITLISLVPSKHKELLQTYCIVQLHYLSYRFSLCFLYLICYLIRIFNIQGLLSFFLTYLNPFKQRYGLKYAPSPNSYLERDAFSQEFKMSLHGWPQTNLTDIIIRRRNFYTQRNTSSSHTQNKGWPRENTMRRWPSATQRDSLQKKSDLSTSWCWTSSSRTVNAYCLSTYLVLFCYGSPSILIQWNYYGLYFLKLHKNTSY